jgi:hypothetical protein
MRWRVTGVYTRGWSTGPWAIEAPSAEGARRRAEQLGIRVSAVEPLTDLDQEETASWGSSSVPEPPVVEPARSISLIPCPACGRRISPEAEACPQCGHPNRRPPPAPTDRIVRDLAQVQAHGHPNRHAQSAPTELTCYACSAMATTRCQRCGVLSCAQHLKNIVVMHGRGGTSELRCATCYSEAKEANAFQAGCVWFALIGWLLLMMGWLLLMVRKAG